MTYCKGGEPENCPALNVPRECPIVLKVEEVGEKVKCWEVKNAKR
jgi:hypothetical protein